MAREVGIADTRTPANDCTRREVRTGNVLQEFFARNFRVFCHRVDSVRDFAQVVRGHRGSHTHGDTRSTVHEHVREHGREHQRFVEGFVEVRAHVHGVLLEVFEHQGAHVVHLRFGVTHCGGTVAVDVTEVTLTEHQRVTQREILRHANESLVNSGVAMRVVLTNHVAHDTRALHRRLVGHHAQLVHTEHHATVHRLEAVSCVRERTRHNDAHGVAEIAILHVLFDKALELRSWYQFF